jgi:uncharacterized protein YoxC
MEFEMILLTIVEYASIWAPALVAILGIVVMVIQAVHKVKIAIEDFKADKTLAEVNDKLTILTQENEELIQCNKLLLEKITHIKGYADAKKGERPNGKK